MIDIHLIVPILASFLVTFFLTPFWIKKGKQIGLVWENMNKFRSEKLAGSGGVTVVLGFILGILLFIAFRIFYLNDNKYLIQILALLVVVLISFTIGFIDDLLGWRKGGLSKLSRIILVALAAIPLMVINAGDSTISIPFIGITNVGLLYSLILVPIGILAATTTFNFLAGFNGLEAGQGILLLSGISIVTFLTGNSWLSVIGVCMIVCLLAFIFYNFYPAKIFPGDSLTYPVGALVAGLAILGNVEKIAIFFFIPYIIEVILKVRGRLSKQSFGKPLKDGTLDLKYDKIYGLEHLAILLMQKTNIKPTEKKVVYSIWVFQFIIILIGFIIFKNNLFH